MHPATRVRLATFNIENLGGIEGPELDEERIAVLRPLLRRLDADVLCLQEVNAQHPAPGVPRTTAALDMLIAETAYASFERAVSLRPGGEAPADVHNLVVLSRFPVVAHAQYVHDLVQPPSWRASTRTPPAETAPVRFDRPLLHVEIDVRGKRLHVINLHLRAPRAVNVRGQKIDALTWRSVGGWAEGAFLAVQKQAAQALEARLLVDRLFEEERDALVAVCGDLNCEAGEMPYRMIVGAVTDTGNPDLAHATLVPAERSVPEAERFSVLHAGEPHLPDHILVSRGLADALATVDAITDGVADEELTPEPVAGSTHAPLVAEFMLRCV